MLLLDITIVNVALPRIQSSLDAGLTGLQWVVDAYALALAALILTAGALADRYGRRLMFVFGVIVFGLLRGNAHGWTSTLILGSLIGGAVLLAAFVVVERRQERPMLDVSLFRQPAFVGVSIATFCIGAGMFALFPFLSIYLQDILGFSPLGAGLRFLPLTVFVFAVPLATRRLTARLPIRVVLGGGLVEAMPKIIVNEAEKAMRQFVSPVISRRVRIGRCSRRLTPCQT